MVEKEAKAKVEPRFSSRDAAATAWAAAREQLESSDMYRMATVRPLFGQSLRRFQPLFWPIS
ncbi:MAG: hypothetical protein NVSMB42_13560 [Herpetosiphon sp.]